MRILFSVALLSLNAHAMTFESDSDSFDSDSDNGIRMDRQIYNGTEGFTWLDSSQPDNAHGATQNCVLLFAANSVTTYKKVNWFPGALDDVSCSTSEFEKTGARVVRGYVCGQPARG
uniref:C-type lectin domain-containing protein n=1 Tax=Caenorhabditis japonica TaxID=281687 RepID=A0A8R1DF39_CAEJA